MPQADDAFQRFIDEFTNENDRAAVILGAAKLDTLLYQILDRHFVPSPSGSDELLDGDSPLSTFSAKVNICFRLGLISPELAKALNIIRRIRNSFAHEVAGAHLESGPQADRLNSLLIPLRPLPMFISLRGLFLEGQSSASADFKACLALLTISLEGLLEDVQPVSGDPLPFILDYWREHGLPAPRFQRAETLKQPDTEISMIWPHQIIPWMPRLPHLDGRISALQRRSNDAS